MSAIFVFAPTGTVGSLVADQLAQKGVHFKAAVREGSKGEELKKKYGDKVEPIIINLYDPISLDAAFTGVEKVFLGLPPGTFNNILLLAINFSFRPDIGHNSKRC
jgi:uncharacterized protein YbjT (DUF2867 family)